MTRIRKPNRNPGRKTRLHGERGYAQLVRQWCRRNHRAITRTRWGTDKTRARPLASRED